VTSLDFCSGLKLFTDKNLVFDNHSEKDFKKVIKFSNVIFRIFEQLIISPPDEILLIK